VNAVLTQYPQFAPGEVSRIAREIYEREIKDKVEPEHRGKYLVLDILTGAYEIDEDDVVLSKRAAERFPEGVRYGMRIGYPASGRI
jgi:ABC-type branched-subunit amino acid transport system ATPase component